jgi:hypothetical protein
MLSSKFLVHWTGQKDIEALSDREKSDQYAARLKDWYQHGLFARRADVEVILRLPGENNQVNKFKMKRLVRICLTEIRVSQADSHSKRYGKLGIGFERDFIANKGGRPVIYVPRQARVQLMEQSVWQAWDSSVGNPTIHEPFNWLFAFVKPMSNDSPVGSQDYEDYYEEMEWRLVYGEGFDRSGTFLEGAEMNTYRVKFEPSDVKVIVFPDDEALQRTVNDADMKRFFGAHHPNLLRLADCGHF